MQITDAEGCELVAEFFTNFLGDATTAPLRVLEAPGNAFADARCKPNATAYKYVSLINRASLAALEAVTASRWILSDFARTSISMEYRPGVSTTGSTLKSPSDRLGCG